MAYPRLDPELAAAAVEAVKQHGTMSAAARALGIPRPTLESRVAVAKRYATAPPPPPQPTVVDHVHTDRIRARQRKIDIDIKAKYAEALKTIERQQREADAWAVLKSVGHIPKILPNHGSGTSEATPVLCASDWHVEERVGSEVGGLNVYSPEIAEARAKAFFANGLRLIKLLGRDVTITNCVIALLGDFISNDIHEAESVEANELHPTHAILHAQALIIAGIEFLLSHSKLTFTIPCHSGNHARTTKTTRFGAENGHSLEYLMYLHLAAYFRHEPRVTFLVPDGMHSYIEIYGRRLRFHHGHAVKYGGGVGGIYIPVNKAIAQWNKARHADLDVFGHFHQMRDGGNFICNGSLIGYSAFALSIKADFEPPKQALFLMDKKRGKTCVWPVLLEP